mmetsp:Transcript_7335/g.20697  ORF Transcript_7335/g.20697 Transcript_7335/m.20697 type:complete len:106 (+) Transcript_7335:305-622(+)
MKRLIPLLAPSASFVIFSNSLQPLTEGMNHLQQSKQAVCLSLTESWHRSYQVLPARTHPTMSTSGTGGYMLSGVKVVNTPPPPAAERASNPKPQGSRGRQKRQRR